MSDDSEYANLDAISQYFSQIWRRLSSSLITLAQASRYARTAVESFIACGAESLRLSVIMVSTCLCNSATDASSKAAISLSG